MNYCMCSYGGSCHYCKPDEWFKVEIGTAIVWQKKSEIVKERKIKMKFERLTYHDILIRHTTNGGLIVKVGCAELVFSGYKMMLEAMEEFYKDPHAMEKEYNDNQGQDLADTAECEDCGPDPRADTPRTQALGPPPSGTGANRR